MEETNRLTLDLIRQAQALAAVVQSRVTDPTDKVLVQQIGDLLRGADNAEVRRIRGLPVTAEDLPEGA